MSHQVGNRSFTTGAIGHGSWPRAMVFDCDDLLVATRSSRHAAYREVAAQVPDRAALDTDAFDGMTVADAATRLSTQLMKPIPATMLTAALLKRFETDPLELLSGADRLLGLLGASGFPTAVATNAPRAVVDTALRRTGIADRFAAVVTVEDVDRGKPAADVYLAACAALDTHPSDSVAFEDSQIGSLAARQAGLFVVGVPSRLGAPPVADLLVSCLDDQRLVGTLGLDRVPHRGRRRFGSR